MARLYLTILAIFAMIYSAVALPAVKGRQLEGDVVPVPISVNITLGPAEVSFPPNVTFPPNATFPAPNSTETNSTVILASRTRRSLRSFPIDLPVPYKA